MSKPTNLYFDYAATTPLHPGALEAMMPYMENDFGNPSGMYNQSRTAKKAVEHARRQVAGVINAKPEEIFFTGGGTESDNWALKGVAEALKNKGKHIITTSVEHHALLYTAKYLEKQGYTVTYLPVDGSGSVSPEDVEKALRPDTILVSVSLANNEVGVIQPLAEISKITKKHKIYLHTDAVQAVGHIAVDVEELNLDLLSLSAHKFYGPKGVGALYVRSGTPIAPLMHGGHQESKRRAGTENVAGIVGMGEALFLSAETLENEITRLSLLRDHLIYGLEEKIPHVYVNGPRPDTPGQRQVRLPGNVNMSFSFVEGESLLMLLDMQGCSASTGSACASGSLDPSHVLMAMGISHERANSALRFTLGRHTTERDVKALIKMLPPIVNRLREMSPMYTDFVNKEK